MKISFDPSIFPGKVGSGRYRSWNLDSRLVRISWPLASTDSRCCRSARTNVPNVDRAITMILKRFDFMLTWINFRVPIWLAIQRTFSCGWVGGNKNVAYFIFQLMPDNCSLNGNTFSIIVRFAATDISIYHLAHKGSIQINTRNGKSFNTRICQASIYRSPACAIVLRTINSAQCPEKKSEPEAANVYISLNPESVWVQLVPLFVEW